MGIITFGVTFYESASLGLPSFVISHNEENYNSVKSVCKFLNSPYLGKSDSLDYSKVCKNIIDFVEKDKKFPKIKNLYKVDNHGAKRIAKLIMNFI